MSSIQRHRSVADVMTRHVHVATPSTPFKELVRLIQENHISAVPIVNQRGMPIGVVSESDLLLKECLADVASEISPVHVWNRRHVREKASGVVASDVMTSPAITVGMDATVSEAARVMQERQIRRLVVVDARGNIAGIATRSDLLRLFMRTDESLRDELLRKVFPAVLPGGLDGVHVNVALNVITLSGEVDRRSDVHILGRLAGQVDGAVAVRNELGYRWDDLRRQAQAT
jgi:CBS domain-containing protein